MFKYYTSAHFTKNIWPPEHIVKSPNNALEMTSANKGLWHLRMISFMIHLPIETEIFSQITDEFSSNDICICGLKKEQKEHCCNLNPIYTKWLSFQTLSFKAMGTVFTWILKPLVAYDKWRTIRRTVTCISYTVHLIDLCEINIKITELLLLCISFFLEMAESILSLNLTVKEQTALKTITKLLYF